PSIPFIIYGVAAETSVGDMFIAGIIPGILFGLLLMVWAYIYSKKKGFKTRSENITFKQFLVALWECKWVLIIPFIILGGIYGGIFTPTEAGVVAVVVAIFISFFLERDMTIKDLSVVLRDSALTTSTILIIVAVATVFGEF